MSRWRSIRRATISRQPFLPGLYGSGEKLENSRSGQKLGRLISSGETALDRARTRLIFAFLLFSILYSIIAGRLINLTVLGDVSEVASPHHVGEGAASVSRADIVDRNGLVLATSLPLFSVCADSRKILDPKDATRKLLGVLPDLDRARLAEALNTGKRCASLKRHLTPRQYYAINKLGIAGLEFSPDEGRLYPSGNITSHVVGYADIDNHGIAGLEKSLDARLQQKQEPVVLTLDLRLQTILYRELGAAIRKFHAVGGAGVIMDVTNGAILALISLPDFDPQHPGNVSDAAQFNRATLGVYEMGSTFKIFNTALALDSGLIKPAERFDTVHPVKIGSQVIRDPHVSTRWLNVAEIFSESSNVGSARMAERFGSSRQRTFLDRLGLLAQAPLELPEVGSPLVPTKNNWGHVATMTISFGHGIAVNAVQLSAAVAAIVHNGLLFRPTLLKNVAAESSPTRVISPHTSVLMRALMRLVVTHGTAKTAEVEGYLVGGKTGTADKIKDGHYDSGARLSSFVGVFPLNAPRYVVLAILDDPKAEVQTGGYAAGGWTAAPVVGKVISQMGPLVNVPPLSPAASAAEERRLLRPLGSEVLDGFRAPAEKKRHAPVRPNTAP